MKPQRKCFCRFQAINPNYSFPTLRADPMSTEFKEKSYSYASKKKPLVSKIYFKKKNVIWNAAINNTKHLQTRLRVISGAENDFAEARCDNQTRNCPPNSQCSSPVLPGRWDRARASSCLLVAACCRCLRELFPDGFALFNIVLHSKHN